MSGGVCRMGGVCECGCGSEEDHFEGPTIADGRKHSHSFCFISHDCLYGTKYSLGISVLCRFDVVNLYIDLWHNRRSRKERKDIIGKR